jgi:hypothetical protein
VRRALAALLLATALAGCTGPTDTPVAPGTLPTVVWTPPPIVRLGTVTPTPTLVPPLLATALPTVPAPVGTAAP